MYRDILTNKWFLGGVGFLIVLAVACVLWYQHDIAPDRKAAADAEEFARQWKKNQKAKPKATTAEQATEKSPADSDTPNAEKSINETTPVTDNTEEVRVSPHGFGPYPEVPEDYIIKPFSWDFYKNDPPIYELMARVRVKLWKQGIRTTGIGSCSATGLVYPTIPGAVFVKKYNLDGIDHLEIRGDPELDLEAIRKSLMDGNVPEGITVLDMDDAGIDPYTFLNLNK